MPVHAVYYVGCRVDIMTYRVYAVM